MWKSFVLFLLLGTLGVSGLNAQDFTFRWAHRGGGSGADSGQDLATDAAGNVYVTGFFSGSATFGSETVVSHGPAYDMFVCKYSAAGDLLWIRTAGGPGFDRGTAVAVDLAGRVYVTGQFTGTAQFGERTLHSRGQEDVFMLQYSAEGQLVWLKQYGGTGRDAGRALAVDTRNFVFLTGTFEEQARFDLLEYTSRGRADVFFTKLTPDGVMYWTYTLQGTGQDEVHSLVYDSDAGLYLTGSFTDSLYFHRRDTTLISHGGEDAFFLKYDTEGRLRWAMRGGGSQGDALTDAVYHPEGYLVVTGYFSDTANYGHQRVRGPGGRDLLLAAYDPDGQMRWIHTGGSAQGHEEPHGLALHPSGQVLLTGKIEGPFVYHHTTLPSPARTGTPNILLASIDPQNGSPHRLMEFGGPDTDLGHAVAADREGRMYLAGFYNQALTVHGQTLGSTGSTDLWVAAFHAPAIEVTTSPDARITCGDSWPLEARAVGQQLTWAWEPETGLDDPTSPNPTAQPRETTTYTVTVRSLLGVVRDSVRIEVQPVAAPAIEVEGSTAFCEGDSAVLIAPEGYAAYRWNGRPGERRLTVRTGGLYTLEVENQGGCRAEQRVRVLVFPAPEKPVISASGPLSFCIGDSVVLTAPEGYAAYRWNQRPGSRKYVARTTGRVELVVENAPGCAARAAVDVSAHTYPPMPSLAAVPATAFCPGDSVELVAARGYRTWYWNGMPGPNRIWVQETGVHTLEVENAPGCRTQTEIELTHLPQPPEPVVVAVPGSTFCAGDSVELIGPEDAVAWFWNGNPGPQRIWVNEGGRYVLEIENASGCRNGSTLNLTAYPQPMQPIIIQERETLRTQTGYAAYQWFRHQEVLPGETKPELTLDRDGIYHVEVQNTSGCVAASVADTFLITSRSADREMIRFRIRPNPAHDRLRIDYTLRAPGPAGFTLYDLQGRRIQSWGVFEAGTARQTQVLPLSVPSGLYFLELKTRHHAVRRKLQVLRP